MTRARLPLVPDVGLAILLVTVFAAFVIAACRRTRPPPRFPHEFHLTKAGCGRGQDQTCLNCTSCHTPSKLGTPHDGPDAALCESCHQGRDREALAVLTRSAAPVNRGIHFDHDSHLKLDGLNGQCVPCHAGVVNGHGSAMPGMTECFGCHEHASEWQRGECVPCHDPIALARTLPVTFLRHDAAFARHHGNSVTTDQQGKLCQSCHTQDDCQSCHDLTPGLTIERRRPERVESRQVHRGDFVVRHAIEARSEPARCLSCHTASTCDGCHVTRGVSANLENPRSPHPPEWMGNDFRSSNFHGSVARRDILACASCHEAGPATNCVRCHRVGAHGGNPHPNGWNSARGTDSEMCGYCHG